MRQRWRQDWQGTVVGIAALSGALLVWDPQLLPPRAGGGAGLLAMLVVALVLGLPMAWLEGSIGSALQASLPVAMRKTGRRALWLTWWGQALLVLVAGLLLTALAWMASLLLDAGGSWLLGGTALAVGGEAVDLAPTPLSALVLGALVALMVVHRALAGGLARIARAAAWLLSLALLATLAGLALLSHEADGRAGMLRLLSFEPEQLLEPGVWLTAFRQVLAMLLFGCGTVAMCCSFRRRDADVGGRVLLMLLGAVLVQVLMRLLIAGLAGVQALQPDAAGELVLHGRPAPFWPPSGRLGSGHVLALFGLGALLLAQLLALLLTLRSSWRDQIGDFAAPIVRRLVLAISVVAGLAVIAGAGQAATLAQGLLYYALPTLGLAMALWAGWQPGFKAFEDHITAYSQIRVFGGWRLVLAVLVPAAGVLVVLQAWAADRASVERAPQVAGLLFGPALLALVPALMWQTSGGRHRLRFRRRPLLAGLALIVLGVGALLAWQRLPVQALQREVHWLRQQVAREAWPETVAATQHPLPLARRAWDLQRFDLAVELLGAWLQARPQDRALPEVAAWVRELQDRAGYAIGDPRAPRAPIFQALRLLAVLGGPAARQPVLADIAYADWFTDARLAALHSAAAALALELGHIEGQEAAWQLVGTLRSLCQDLDPQMTTQLLLAGPPAVAVAVEHSAALLRQHLQALLAAGATPEVLAEQAALLVQVQPWQDLPVSLRQAWAARVVRREPDRGGLLTLAVVLVGCLSLAVLLAWRGVRRRPMVDPRAETLENLDPIEVDSEAHTVDDRLRTTSDGSSLQTPVAVD